MNSFIDSIYPVSDRCFKWNTRLVDILDYWDVDAGLYDAQIMNEFIFIGEKDLKNMSNKLINLLNIYRRAKCKDHEQLLDKDHLRMHSVTINDDMIISWIKNKDIKNIRNFSKQINKIVIIKNWGS